MTREPRSRCRRSSWMARGGRWITAAMLWGAALGNQVSGASTPALNSVLFAVEFPRLGISVFSASGQRRFTLKPVPAAMPSDDRETETYLHAYFAPSVDPDNRLLVYVDCSGLV